MPVINSYLALQLDILLHLFCLSIGICLFVLFHDLQCLSCWNDGYLIECEFLAVSFCISQLIKHIPFVQVNPLFCRTRLLFLIYLESKDFSMLKSFILVTLVFFLRCFCFNVFVLFSKFQGRCFNSSFANCFS